MVVESLRYSVEAQDDTQAGASAIADTLGSAFRSAAEEAGRVGEALNDGVEEAVDDTRRGPLTRLREGLEQAGSRGALAIGTALAGAISTALQGLNEALNLLEERRNALEVALFNPSPAEEGLLGDITSFGFSADEGSAGVLATRAFGLEGSQEATNIGLAGAQLNRVGVNTRFLRQVAQRFGVLDDPNQFVAQLGVGADVVSQAGVDFEEVFSEIADNPEVYGAFPTFAHAAQFIVSQGLIPSEVTIQLQGGFLAPTGGAVTGDPYTLTGITPTSRERLEQHAVFQGISGGLGAVPILGGELAGFADATFGAGASLGDRFFGTPGDRTNQFVRTFQGEAGAVIVDGAPVELQRAADAMEQIVGQLERISPITGVAAAGDVAESQAAGRLERP